MRCQKYVIFKNTSVSGRPYHGFFPWTLLEDFCPSDLFFPAPSFLKSQIRRPLTTVAKQWQPARADKQSVGMKASMFCRHSTQNIRRWLRCYAEVRDHPLRAATTTNMCSVRLVTQAASHPFYSILTSSFVSVGRRWDTRRWVRWRPAALCWAINPRSSRAVSLAGLGTLIPPFFSNSSNMRTHTHTHTHNKPSTVTVNKKIQVYTIFIFKVFKIWQQTHRTKSIKNVYSVLTECFMVETFK